MPSGYIRAFWRMSRGSGLHISYYYWGNYLVYLDKMLGRVTSTTTRMFDVFPYFCTWHCWHNSRVSTFSTLISDTNFQDRQCTVLWQDTDQCDVVKMLETLFTKNVEAKYQQTCNNKIWWGWLWHKKGFWLPSLNRYTEWYMSHT